MHLPQYKLCTRKTELALGVKFCRGVHRVHMALVTNADQWMWRPVCISEVCTSSYLRCPQLLVILSLLSLWECLFTTHECQEANEQAPASVKGLWISLENSHKFKTYEACVYSQPRFTDATLCLRFPVIQRMSNNSENSTSMGRQRPRNVSCYFPLALKHLKFVKADTHCRPFRWDPPRSPGSHPRLIGALERLNRGGVLQAPSSTDFDLIRDEANRALKYGDQKYNITRTWLSMACSDERW